MIYLSKAMDLFDMSSPALRALAERYAAADPHNDAQAPFPFPSDPVAVSASRPRPADASHPETDIIPEETQKQNERFIPTSKSPHLRELAQGLQRLKDIPALVLGVQSDVLFPVESQRELADALKMTGNQRVTYYELGGVWGHDTFLLDVQNVGGAIRGFLH
jgi:homoserine O-acetyltransferase